MGKRLDGILILVAIFATLMFIAMAVETATVEAILVTGIGGVGVSSLTQIVKKFIESTFRFSEKWLGVVLSLIVSMVATALYLASAGWSTWLFVVYTILVWGVANGFFKIANPE